MKRRQPSKLLISAVCCGLFVSTGCQQGAPANRRTASTTWRLDDAAVVRVTERVGTAAGSAATETAFREVRLEVQALDDLLHEQILYRQEGSGIAPPFALEALEVRATPDRRVFWVIDSTTNRVVATYDRKTTAGTVFGEPPPWPEAAPAEPLPRESGVGALREPDTVVSSESAPRAEPEPDNGTDVEPEPDDGFDARPANDELPGGPGPRGRP